MDVNGDGKMNFIIDGWFGKALPLRENLGNNNE
jgi:hypothetical protein